MDKAQAFEEFAPLVLRTYRRDKEAFWAAAMAPFLSDNSILSMWKHRQVGADLMAAFKGLDGSAKQVLKHYSAPFGIDLTGWKSLQIKAEYFKDAYPVFAFLAIWMEEEGLDDLLARFGGILEAAAFGIAGYGILDVNVDGGGFSPVEILTSQALVAEYETRLLDVFGVTPVNLAVLHRVRSLFLEAEIKEKSVRGKASPYSKNNPKACGFKAAHLLTAFMLGLERLGKSELIDDYFEVFFLFGAVIQILDDWKDLEDDLSIGHYSFVTLNGGGLPAGKDPREQAKRLRSDMPHVREVYDCCKTMITEAQAILTRLNDPFLARLVTVTDLRLDAYFRKDLRLTI